MPKIVVLVKDIVDLNELKIDPTTREPNIKRIKRRMSDLDKRALEAAIQIKEQLGGEVSTLSLGDNKTKTATLEALAMGADAAFIVKKDENEYVDSLVTSKVLKKGIDKIGEYDLIICGEMTLDRLSAQIGPRIAELLDLPLIAYVKKLKFSKGKIIAIRDLEDVDEVVEVNPPAVLTVVREINEPRIPSLMNIMKAKRKPTEEWSPTVIGFDLKEIENTPSIKILKMEAPLIQRKRVVIQSDTVEEAAKKLVDVMIDIGVLEG